MISLYFLPIMSYASSHEIRSHLPSPFLPARFIGYSRRSGWYSTFRCVWPFTHGVPAVIGLEGSPTTLTRRPFTFSQIREHVSWQLRPQTLYVSVAELSNGI